MTNSDYLEFEPLLMKVVGKYIMNPYIPIDDLIQIGAMGMMKGFRNYKSNKGTKLSTYLYKTIEWAILQELNNYSRVKAQYTVVSLEGDENILYELIPSATNVAGGVIEDMTLQEYITELKYILTPIQLDILLDRYINNISIQDIADKHNIKYRKVQYIISQSQRQVLKKSFRIRAVYRKYIDSKRKNIDVFLDPLKVVGQLENLNYIIEKINNLDKLQLKFDEKYLQ
jgi:RNA polymerase sporulation-specific sigma factor